ncbi:peptide chain release factor N(5)-glutamine methyltransferase [Alisedimentitalea sp. MJ-SS2]|uniref:peptide chain release factor N(5)-glutamine methyltransferase n=1 Tax=Aliisedimentitalea sp. MJ-SS2 TaxID=3049795 RepID=UPI002912867B|nr:peptide chain release factor N(5)-glutamine methyltransferase [Alisedimentitalea sp. MJ-SS2]MDU8926556.1 peptide chain release factor N(5)-glutamine methyltransferase [Alisedimentitalea sp. MJ-SS2]
MIGRDGAVALTVRDGLAGLTRYFRDGGIETPGTDARLLLAHVLQVEPGRLIIMADDPLKEAALERAYVLGARRRDREPMSHILGGREFYGRWLEVTGDVLDPRPETETLIEAALRKPFNEVLDLGTGSGAILVSLLAEKGEATGIGTDLSGRALAVAEKNAEALGVGERAGFLESDWYAGVAGQFDLIVSNPPYIAADEMPGLAPELAHEPRMALTDEADGFSAYRIIAQEAPEHLLPNGRLMVEIGPTQGAVVAAMFREAGFDSVEILPDLDGRDRVVAGVKPRE